MIQHFHLFISLISKLQIELLLILLCSILHINLSFIKVINKHLILSFLSQVVLQLLLLLLCYILHILQPLHFHHSFSLMSRQEHLLIVIKDLPLLLISKVLIESSPSPVFLIFLSVHVIYHLIVVTLVSDLFFSLELFLKLFIGQKVSHLSGVVSFLFELSYFGILFT